MGLLTNRVERSELAAGDHIYTWRNFFTYAHHGIYVGGSKVVHFTCEQNDVSEDPILFSALLNSSSSSSRNVSASSTNVSASRTNVSSSTNVAASSANVSPSLFSAPLKCSSSSSRNVSASSMNVSASRTNVSSSTNVAASSANVSPSLFSAPLKCSSSSSRNVSASSMNVSVSRTNVSSNTNVAASRTNVSSIFFSSPLKCSSFSSRNVSASSKNMSASRTNASSSRNVSASRTNVSSSTNVSSTCTIPDCGFQQKGSGVLLSCLDCFLDGGRLYRFDYGVSAQVLLRKVRGGTCTTAQSDPPEEVMHRAMYLLQNGFGKYNLVRNNCEDFALYCKTGVLLPRGRSGQVAAVKSTVTLPLQLLFMPSLALLTAGMYWFDRYTDGLDGSNDKVEVEELTSFRSRISYNENHQ